MAAFYVKQSILLRKTLVLLEMNAVMHKWNTEHALCSILSFGILTYLFPKRFGFKTQMCSTTSPSVGLAMNLCIFNFQTAVLDSKIGFQNENEFRLTHVSSVPKSTNALYLMISVCVSSVQLINCAGNMLASIHKLKTSIFDSVRTVFSPNTPWVPENLFFQYTSQLVTSKLAHCCKQPRKLSKSRTSPRPGTTKIHSWPTTNDFATSVAQLSSLLPLTPTMQPSSSPGASKFSQAMPSFSAKIQFCLKISLAACLFDSPVSQSTEKPYLKLFHKSDHLMQTLNETKRKFQDTDRHYTLLLSRSSPWVMRWSCGKQTYGMSKPKQRVCCWLLKLLVQPKT